MPSVRAVDTPALITAGARRGRRPHGPSRFPPGPGRGMLAAEAESRGAMEPKLEGILGEVSQARGRVLVLTGAGVSAESGIPTFRGKEGYWVVGSRNYVPQEMATLEMFRRNPEEVWRWYLYRFGVVRHAQPNAGHRALAALEEALQDRFTL